MMIWSSEDPPADVLYIPAPNIWSVMFELHFIDFGLSVDSPEHCTEDL
jgi:hypothetical protein